MASGIRPLILLFCCWAVCAPAGYAAQIKEPNVSGVFYPDDSLGLSRMIGDLLNAADPPAVNGDIFALICPHAGYGYSGKTAASGYKLIESKPYRTVVVIGSSHYYGFRGASVYGRGEFRTPLGDIGVDEDFARKLLGKLPFVAFMPEVFSGQEHTVEVQLPFLQMALTDFKIVPIITGDMSLSDCRQLAALLKKAIGQRKDVLIVASTDMYHGGDYEALEATDKSTISFLENMDSEGLYKGLRAGKLQLCGGPSVVTSLILAKESGHEKLQVLNYTNSAEVTGKKSDWMVGYVSCAIDSDRGGKMLNKEQKKKLLDIARSSISAYLSTGKKLEVSEDDPALLKEMGAFVTLHKQGDLRGCIGNLQGRKPLCLTVRDMSVEAATGDPRFPPVKPDELKYIDIEISALSPLERIESADEIEMGTHGVLVRRGFNSGVFLPQVATETGWSKEEFLSALCSHKAGLSPDAWKDKSTELYIFTAEVFSEKEAEAGE